MHYTLDQCKELAKALLAPAQSHSFLQVNLNHAMPWPSDDHIKAIMLEEAKSKKKAALRLGITKRCLRRRLCEIKELGYSTSPTEPLTVRTVLERLLRNQSFQQISVDTEVNQAWLCRLLTNLMVAFRQRYDIPSLRSPRVRRTTSRVTPTVTRITTPWRITGGNTGRIEIVSTPWVSNAISNATTNTVEFQWINAIDFTDATGDVESPHDSAQANTSESRPDSPTNPTSGQTPG